MMNGRRFVIAVLVSLLASSLTVHAEEPIDVRQSVTIKVDPVALIKKATAKYKGLFKVNEQSAVSQMDMMLTEQYSSRGRISNEKDANLKSLYYQAATLLLNGYPIAGGTLVSVARNDPRFSQSSAGGGMASFVDAMLQPSDEDLDLVEMQKRVESARDVYKDTRADLRFYVDLWVIGHIYLDNIAVDAGKNGVDAMKATSTERKVIQKALAAK